MQHESRTRERGIALVAALLFAMTILGLVSAIISAGISNRTQSRYLIARQGAQQAAESGVHLVLARLGGPGGPTLIAAGQAAGLIRGTGERAPRYDVRIALGGTDGTDNDLDGLVDEVDETDMIELVSSGYFDGVMRTVRVTLLARYRTPVFNSAAYLESPIADIDLRGNAFRVSGIDQDLAGNPTGELVPGIGVNGPTNLILSQISGIEEDNITGLGGTPSVQTVPALDLTELVEEGARSANIVLDPAQPMHQPSEPGEWGTLSEPAIIYAPGPVHISGGGSGAGILIVNGDLDISGSFEWKGIVIVRGEIDLRGGGGTKRIVGALIVQTELDMDDGMLNFELNGTVDILFSRQTLNRISQAFASYSILNWREGPNPDYEALP